MICRVDLDVTGWHPTDKPANWQTVACDDMKLLLTGMPVPFPLERGLEQVREFFRHVVTRRKGALISCDPVRSSDPPLFRTVYKYPTGRGQAVTFEASLALPLGNVCLELLITASEDSITGVREALVIRDLMKTAGTSEREQLARNELPIEWKFERYHPGTRGSWAYVISDDEQYDAAYPRHPLTRVRRWLRRIERTYRVVIISEEAPQNQIQIHTLPLKPMTFEELTRELGFDVASDAMTAEAIKKLPISFPPLADRQKVYRDQRDAEMKKVIDADAKVQSVRKAGEKVAAELTPDSAKLILARIRASGRWLIKPEGGRLALTIFTRMAFFDDYTETKELPIEPVSVTIRELFSRFGELRELGIDSLTIDRCPRCNDDRVTQCLDELTDEQRLLLMYGIHVAGRRYLVEEKLQAAMRETDTGKRMESLRYIVEHLNPGSVETRVEIARMAIANRDTRLYEQCRDHLARYAPEQMALLPDMPDERRE